jgi:hypothetical protein
MKFSKMTLMATCALPLVPLYAAAKEFEHGKDPSQLHFPPANAKLVVLTSASSTVSAPIVWHQNTVHEADYAEPAPTQVLHLDGVTKPR